MKNVLYTIVAFMLTASFALAADEKTCGKITVTFSTGKTVTGDVVAEKLSNGDTAIRARFNGYAEKGAWIAVIQKDSPRHEIEKAAIEACLTKKAE